MAATTAPAAPAAAAPAPGKRKSGPARDNLQKIKSTVGWYNHHGGLTTPIIYKNARVVLEAIHPQLALHILSGLKDKAPTIRDPTAWVKKAAVRFAPELDPRVKRTIAWYNKHGGLPSEIYYDEVRVPLAALPPGTALRILKGLEGAKVRDPTWWIIGAATKELDRIRGSGASRGGSWDTPVTQETADALGIDIKVGKTLAWYNKSGQLQQPIDIAEVGPLLGKVGTAGALEILKGLEGQGAGIKNPTGWIQTAAQRKVAVTPT